jgi:hypothetical protein
MRRLSAMVLMVTTCGQPIFSTGADAATPAGPIERSAMREASRMAAGPQAANWPTYSWRRVRGIEPAASITVTTAQGVMPRVFVAADDATLTVLNFSGSQISEASERTLRDVARTDPSSLVDGLNGVPRAFSPVRFDNDDVFVAGTRVGVRADLLQRVLAPEVLSVTASKRRGSGGAAALGAIGGVFLGSILASAMLVNCYHCSGGAIPLAFGLVFGTPIAAGYGAWRLSSSVVDDVIYRRVP